MEEALKKYNINYIRQQQFEIGIMDFYLPEGNVAVFVDGDVWHANPEKYKCDDILFYGKTANSIWNRDLYHNSHLKSRGFRVLRFWENEINRNIDACIKKILSRLKLGILLVIMGMIERTRLEKIAEDFIANSLKEIPEMIYHLYESLEEYLQEHQLNMSKDEILEGYFKIKSEDRLTID